MQTATDSIEQRHAELGFERVNLPRGGWLTQVQPRRRPMNAARFHDLGLINPGLNSK
jgi:hypothetical protein